MSSNNDSRHKRIKVLCNTVRDDCRTSDEHIVSSLLSLCDRIATLKQEATMLDNETHQVIRERMRLFRESHWAYRNPTVPNSIKYLYDELQGNVPQVTGDPGSSIRNGHPATYARRVDALLQLTQNSYRTRNLEDFGYDEIGMPQGPKTSVAIGYRPVFPKEGALKVPDDVVENNYRSHDGKKKIKQNFADQSAEPNFDSKAFKSDHISHRNQKHTTSSSSCSPFATEKHCGRESTQKKTPSKKSVNSSHVQREIPKGSEFTPTTGTYSPAKKEDAAPTAPNSITGFKSVSGNSFGIFAKAPSAATPTLFGVTPTTGGESDTTVEPKKEDTAAAPTAPNSITGFKSVSGNSFGGFGKAPSAATPTLFGVTPTTGGESATTTTMQDNEVNHVASSSQQVPIASTLPSKTEEPKFDVESMSKATLPPATGVSSAFASFPSSTAAQTAFPQASNQSTFWQQPSTCGNPDASPGSNFPDNSQFPSSGVTPPVSGAGVCPSAGGSAPAAAQSAFGASTPAAAQSAFGASTPAAAQSAFGASTPAAAQSAFGASAPASAHNEFFQQGVLPNNSVCGDSQSGFKVQGSFHAPTTYGVPPTGTIPQAPAGNGGWGKVGNVSAFGKMGGAEGGATKSAFGNLSRPAPAAATGFVSAFGNM